METFVYSREPSDSPRAVLIRTFGAEYLSADEVSLGAIASRVGTLHLVFEAVGVAKVAFEAIESLAPNGVLILTGVPGGAKPVEADLDGVMRDIVLKNQILFGTVNASRAAFEESVRLLEQFMVLFPDAVRGLITERVKLDEAPRLLRRHGGIKQVIQLAA
jgi:threonine dehydrogenase-like Zn-dependent dehydrogenase